MNEALLVMSVISLLVSLVSIYHSFKVTADNKYHIDMLTRNAQQGIDAYQNAEATVSQLQPTVDKAERLLTDYNDLKERVDYLVVNQRKGIQRL